MTPSFTTAEAVETLRNARGGFDLEVSIVQPGGRQRALPRRGQRPAHRPGDRRRDAHRGREEYAAATRLYGLVDDHLLWAWDIAALGQDLRTHASGRLARVE